MLAGSSLNGRERRISNGRSVRVNPARRQACACAPKSSFFGVVRDAACATERWWSCVAPELRPSGMVWRLDAEGPYRETSTAACLRASRT